MTGVPQLVLVGGPNGSGKSTLIARLRAAADVQLPAQYINADDIQRACGLVDAREAQSIATGLRAEALQQRHDLMFETVMSHPSKIAELQRAKAEGYHVSVLFVATEDAAINVARVALRVDAGGHDVAADLVRKRYARTLALAPVAFGYADFGMVFDNSDRGASGEGLSDQAVLADGRMSLLTSAPAVWVEHLVAQVNERAAEIRAFASAEPLAPVLANLYSGETSGPVIVVGKHYVMQFNTQAKVAVLHDRMLLGAAADRLEARQVRRIVYENGVASIEVPLLGKTR